MHTKKLYWTADSPWCRIVLWACDLDSVIDPEFVHLSWQELRAPQSAATLGPELTVPCLSHGDERTSDSLRILALLKPKDFSTWLNSTDGALYRCAEGQFGRVMYALYDDVPDSKIRPHWLRALRAVEQLTAAPAAISPTWGLMAAHTLVGFCVSLKPDWRADLPERFKNQMAHVEASASFQVLKARLEMHSQRIPCAFFSSTEGTSGL